MRPFWKDKIWRSEEKFPIITINNVARILSSWKSEVCPFRKTQINHVSSNTMRNFLRIFTFDTGSSRLICMNMKPTNLERKLANWCLRLMINTYRGILTVELFAVFNYAEYIIYLAYMCEFSISDVFYNFFGMAI